ncbi:MAG: hypothetical protein SXQ77_12405, partial [Halobacteria archaeon]|nr:hypothetical protein [Halobacteria archaeon]
MPAKLSPRRINLYSECKRCYWRYVREGVDRPSGPFPSLPGGMDDIIKNYFDEHRKQGEVPPEIEDEVNAELLGDQEFLENCRDWRKEPRYQ